MKKQWTNKEVVRLCQLYPTTSKSISLVPEFPGRTGVAIRMKAAQLGLRRCSNPQVVPVMIPIRRTSRRWKEIAAMYTPVIFRYGETA